MSMSVWRSLIWQRSPLGFDIEWYVKYRREKDSDGGKTTVDDRPTAVIQLCDPRMILVIQVSAMQGTSPYVCGACALLTASLVQASRRKSR